MAGLATQASGNFSVSARSQFAAAADSEDLTWPNGFAVLALNFGSTKNNDPKSGAYQFCRLTDIMALTAADYDDAVTAANALAFNDPEGAGRAVYVGRTAENKVLFASDGTNGGRAAPLTIAALDLAPSFVEISRALNSQLAGQQAGQYALVIEKQ